MIAASPASWANQPSASPHCLGLNPRAEIYDRLARPHPLALGEVIRGIL